MIATLATDRDRAHLRRALELAERGRGQVSPNPLVGAVVVRDGEVLGEGFHARLGDRHAERAALDDCIGRGHDTAGATVYVTLEPCAHQGRQPPCAQALAEAGVARVVYASDDPSEKAGGRGPGILRDEGIACEAADGPEASAARLLNQPFRKHARTGRPLVVLKSAVSLDGRTASAAGSSKWISGPESRAQVHGWRAEADAVAVGIGTALADDPTLDARGVDPPPRRQPLRVVFDSSARLPLESTLVRGAAGLPLLVFVAPVAPTERVDALRAAGAEVVAVDGDEPARVRAAVAELGRREVTSVLLEGGARLAGAFLAAGEIDELRLFLAPLVIGGDDARPLLAGTGAREIGEAPRALAMDWERSGDDLLVRARLREW